MDRCRCKDYEEAVKNLRLYTIGTIRPAILDLYDRTGFDCGWVNNKIDPTADLRFQKPVSRKTLTPEEMEKHLMFLHNKNYAQMWCSHLKRPPKGKEIPKGWPNWEFWMQE